MSQFTVNVIANERKKLRAVQDKLAAGQGPNSTSLSHARALGLANAAATIAQRILIVLDNEIKGRK